MLDYINHMTLTIIKIAPLGICCQYYDIYAADAQAGLRLCCSQTPKDRFSRFMAQLMPY